MNLGFMNMARSALMLHARSSTQQARNPGIASSHSLAPSPPAPTQTRSLTHSCACSLRGQPRNVTIKRNRAASTANRTAAHRSPNVDEATLPHSAMLAREKGRTFFREVPCPPARRRALALGLASALVRVHARGALALSYTHTHAHTRQSGRRQPRPLGRRSGSVIPRTRCTRTALSAIRNCSGGRKWNRC
jgi:hypothetical protein